MRINGMGRIGFVVLAVLLIVGMTGCTPAMYTDGVKVDRDYPDDVVPVYDDSVTFEFDNDSDEEFTLSIGTEDDIDDVIEFYQEYFEDEGIQLTVEEEEDDEYEAEGIYDGYEFELTIEEPRGPWEEKLFRAVIEITVTVSDEPEPTPTPEPTPEPTAEPTPTPEPTLESAPTPNPESLILGSWYVLEDMMDGQPQYYVPVEHTFNADYTGATTYLSQGENRSDDFTWGIAGSTLTINQAEGGVLTRQYTLTEDALITTHSEDGFEHSRTYTREEAALDIFPGVGAWIVQEGEYEWSMGCSLWPDGTGWLWWTDDNGEDIDLEIVWFMQGGYLVFVDQDNVYYVYDYIYDGDSLTLTNELGTSYFGRSDGEWMTGTWHYYKYVDDVIAYDQSLGLIFYADGTGSAYHIDSNEQPVEPNDFTWYLTEEGRIVIVEPQATSIADYHLQSNWLLLRIFGEEGEDILMWFEYMVE